jgi:cysteine desulfurase/selenocysteine lyase
VTVAQEATSFSPLDIARIRRDFPILSETIHGKPLVYLDNAATTHKSTAVIQALSTYYESQNSNIHRGVHYLSCLATRLHDEARAKVQTFINAAESAEVIFVRGTTEAINLVAHSYGMDNIGAGDEVLITHMEHHSNIVPWQLLCNRVGATLRVAPIDDDGCVDIEAYERLLGPQTKFVAFAHVSNALGTINPVKVMIDLAHKHGAPVLIDGAQAVAHMPVDVQDLDCDFYAFSSHKLYGPTGMGVLYGKRAFLDAMSPYQGGGDMIRSVTFEKTTFNDLPHKFEAGTPDIAGAIGLGAAIDYLSQYDFSAIEEYETGLVDYATEQLKQVPGIRIVGTAPEKAGVVSFVLECAHPHDIGTILDTEGIAIRTGHHCAQPVMDRYNIPATARASMALYNTTEEIDSLVAALVKVTEVFS